jgi:creatinine amidohydrolase
MRPRYRRRVSMAREVRWERMFPDELEAAFAHCPVVYFAYGLCEPHGPQNALGLDGLKAHGLCCAAARKHGGIVAPPDYWHVHEVGGYAGWAAEWIGERRPWLTAVPPTVHFKNVVYHLRAADALGFHAAILVTGHYGPNWHDLKTIVEILQPHLATRLYGLPDFEANEPGFDGATGDHAGKVETSLLWALEPEAVDMARLPAAPEFAMGDDAPLADLATGERMVADEVAWLGAKAKALLAEYDRLAPTRRPLSFEDVERIWRAEVEPRLPRFASWWTDAPPPPEGSRWRLNYHSPSSSAASQP